MCGVVAVSLNGKREGKPVNVRGARDGSPQWDYVRADPPPYRGLCLLCLLKLGRVIRCVYNCVMAYGTFHYVIMHY